MRNLCALVATITDDVSEEAPARCRVEELGNGLFLVHSYESEVAELFVATRGASDTVEILALLDEIVLSTQVQHLVHRVRVDRSNVDDHELFRVVAEAENTPARETSDEATWRQERTAFCVRDSHATPTRCHLIVNTLVSTTVAGPGADDYTLVAAVHEGELRLTLDGSPACTCIRHRLW